MSGIYAARARGRSATEGKAEGPFVEFLRTVQPKATRLMESYCLAPEATSSIFHDTLETLVWKWETVRDRESWLLAVLQRKCELLARPPGEVRR